MVDEHRRVEPRGIIGSGMATDPDRIRELESEQARRERTDKGKPKRSFASALEEEPQKRTEDTELELEGASADEKRKPNHVFLNKSKSVKTNFQWKKRIWERLFLRQTYIIV